MALHVLSARQVNTASIGDHADGGGLFLRVSATGSSWVLRFTAPDARRREMGLGPAVRSTLAAAGESVAAARKAADKARALLAEGIDPIERRKSDREAAQAETLARKVTQKAERTTLARVARRYHEEVIEPQRTAKHTDAFGAGKHGWKNGVPGTANRPTEGQAEWFNAVQEEIAGVIEATGDALDVGDNAQLLPAVRYLAGPDNPAAAIVINGDGVTDRSAAVAAANATGRPIRFVGVCHVGVATTITVPIVDTLQQIFSATSAITIDNGQALRPEWWGVDNANSLDHAIQALPAGGGEVQLESRVYKPSGYVYGFGGVGSGKYIGKDNVTIRGRRMPRLAADCRSLIGGSVIQGMVVAYASNFELRDVGVDCGKNVLQAFYGDVEQAGITEALIITYPDTDTKAAAPLKHNIRLHNVIGLSSSPGSLTHAMIIGEGVTGVRCTGEIVGCYGVHGIVIKCQDVKAEKLIAYCNNGEGVIIKSDTQVTAVATDIQISQVYARAGASRVGALPCRDHWLRPAAFGVREQY